MFYIATQQTIYSVPKLVLQKIRCHNFWTRSNNLVRYISKLASSPPVFIQTARWHFVL